MIKSPFFEPSKQKNEIRCTLCSHRCTIKEGRRGICGVRQNIKGELYSLVYGELAAENVDAIEKKPIFHLLPGSRSLSISTVGCNFRCRHCQNYSISQVSRLDEDQLRGRKSSPRDVVDRAQKNNCQSISYTYVEPTVFLEFVKDCSVEAHARGLKNILVSNGFLSPDAIRFIAPCLDAINIDIKSFRDDFYRDICGARLAPVLACLESMKESGVWVEATTLIIPGLNDSTEELTEIADYLVSVDPAIPWHVTAFYPTYKLNDRPSTPLETLQKARQLGKQAGLYHVYEGNVHGQGGENTYCHNCGKMLIERKGFSVTRNWLENGSCVSCQSLIPGVWV